MLVATGKIFWKTCSSKFLATIFSLLFTWWRVRNTVLGNKKRFRCCSDVSCRGFHTVRTSCTALICAVLLEMRCLQQSRSTKCPSCYGTRRRRSVRILNFHGAWWHCSNKTRSWWREVFQDLQESNRRTCVNVHGVHIKLLTVAHCSNNHVSCSPLYTDRYICPLPECTRKPPWTPPKAIWDIFVEDFE